MLNLKKTAAAVLALSSSAVFAGTMGPVCTAVNVTVPCESTAWDVGARALYLQPVYSGGGYSYAGVNDSNQFVDYNKNWGWGFMIEGSYHFETGSDANLNWYHFGKSSTRNFTDTSTGTFGAVGNFTNTLNAGSFYTDPKWDAVNLEFGQHVDFGEKKDIRFHGGVQYARIANTTRLAANNTVTVNALGLLTTTVNSTANFERKPTYNGFGPRVGADMGYEWGNGLGIYANGAMSLLAGSSKVSNTYSDNLGNATTSSASKSTIVPELEAKLGLKYDYAVAQGDLTLDVGWMWVNYFNATQTAVGTGSVAVAQEGDFGVQGLYFGLKWMGNVA